MKENLTLAFYISLFALIGVPLIFLVLSVSTGNWLFFIYSLIPALASGLTGLLMIRNRKNNSSYEV